MSEYPECEKLKAIAEKSNLIGCFLDESDYVLCTFNERLNQYWPTHNSLESILAKYFDIDMEKVEAERRAMLEKLR